MGSAIAILEGKPIVPNTPDNMKELRDEISSLSVILDIEGHLTAFQKSIKVLGEIEN